MRSIGTCSIIRSVSSLFRAARYQTRALLLVNRVSEQRTETKKRICLCVCAHRAQTISCTCASQGIYRAHSVTPRSCADALDAPVAKLRSGYSTIGRVVDRGALVCSGLLLRGGRGGGSAGRVLLRTYLSRSALFHNIRSHSAPCRAVAMVARKRRQVVLLHFNGDGCPPMRRAKANSLTNDIKNFLRDGQARELAALSLSFFGVSLLS